MKAFRNAAISVAVATLVGATGAWAADIGAMTAKAPAPVAAAPAGPLVCITIADFFTTACQLAWYGVRFYGTIDVGVGYQTNGAPWNNVFGPGNTYLLSKMNRASMWLLSPNALSQSNVGLQIKEPLGPGWSFVGQLETAFDPYSLNLASGPASLAQNIRVPIALQTSNGDASSQGKFYNTLGYLGFSSDAYGTITIFRQNSLMLDGVRAYDPMGGAYAFSVIGFSGAVAGGGYTQDARATTSLKYRISFGDYRAGVFWQFGGYELGNGSQGSIQGNLGGDFHVGPGVLSVDVIGGFTKDAVSEGLVGPTDAFGFPMDPFTSTNQILTATISNNTNAMALAKYKIDRLTLYAGYEWIQFAPPSDFVTSFNDISGIFFCINCANINGTNINNTAFNNGTKDKILQIVWVGARYALTDALDLAAAYYHYDQNNFATSAANLEACAVAATAKSSCAGTLDAASVLLDWKFAPKWDTYIGTFFSQMNGGLVNGFLAHNNLATTAGVRFRW